jgi:hypothetical protein
VAGRRKAAEATGSRKAPIGAGARVSLCCAQLLVSLREGRKVPNRTET